MFVGMNATKIADLISIHKLMVSYEFSYSIQQGASNFWGLEKVWQSSTYKSLVPSVKIQKQQFVGYSCVFVNASRFIRKNKSQKMLML